MLPVATADIFLVPIFVRRVIITDSIQKAEFDGRGESRIHIFAPKYYFHETHWFPFQRSNSAFRQRDRIAEIVIAHPIRIFKRSSQDFA
jgi:hypothetical protein